MEMTYWEALAHLRRWNMSRWWDILTNDDALIDCLNFAIQDIFIQDSSTFRHIVEDLVWVSDWKNMKYNTTFAIHKIQKCFVINWDTITWTELSPTLFWLTNDPSYCMFEWKQILTHSTINKIRVVYLRDYEPVWKNDTSKKIPLPFRYIPAMMKMAFDWAAPINLMAWETSTTDFYSHWVNRLNTLKQDDSLSDYINVIPAY